MALTALTNGAALNAQSNIAKNNEIAQRAMARISSGSRIVKASDDTASAAIYNKINSLIGGLGQAVSNTAQGSALLQVATGGLNQLTNILTRMRVLGTQTNNATLQQAERNFADLEFQQLKSEYTDIVSQTRFNGGSLLTGGAGSVSALGAVTKAADGLTAAANAFAATLSSGSTGNINGVAQSATVTAAGGGYNVTVVIGDSTGTQTFTAQGAVPVAAGKLTMTSTTNSSNILELDYDGTAITGITNAATFQSTLKTLLGLNAVDAPAKFMGTSVAYAAGNLASATSTSTTTPGTYMANYAANSDLMTLDDGRGNSWSASASAASQVVTFSNGISVVTGASFDRTATMSQVGVTVAAGTAATFAFQVADLSTDTISVSISGVGLGVVGLTNTNVKSVSAAATALDAIATALGTVNEVYATLGAQQKRLEIAQANAETIIENSVAARATYFDANLAEEITTFTKHNVLSQASTAMLTQANQQSQAILAAIRG